MLNYVFPEVYAEQVKVMEKNQYLVIGIFETERKLGLSGAVIWSYQSGQRRLGHAIRHLTVKRTRF